MLVGLVSHPPPFPARYDKGHEEKRKAQLRKLNSRTLAQYNEELILQTQLKNLEQKKEMVGQGKDGMAIGC